MSVKEWCGQHQLITAKYYYRLREVRKAYLNELSEDIIPQSVIPVSAKLMNSGQKSVNPCGLEVSANGISIQVTTDTSPELFKRVLQVAVLNNHRLGKSSEKLKTENQIASMEVDGHIVYFNEAEAVASLTEYDEETPAKVRPKNVKEKRALAIKDLPVVPVNHMMSEEEFIAEFGEDGGYLLRNSLMSPSLEAAIINAKYVNAVPLYRQEQDFEQYGISITRGDMAHWTILCAKRYLAIIYDYLHKKYMTIMCFRQMRLRCGRQRKNVRKETSIICGFIVRGKGI